MEEAWEAPFNQEGPLPLLGDAKVRLLISPRVRAWRISPAFRGGFQTPCARLTCTDARICISAFVHVGVRKRRGGDLLF